MTIVAADRIKLVKRMFQGLSHASDFNDRLAPHFGEQINCGENIRARFATDIGLFGDGQQIAEEYGSGSV